MQKGPALKDSSDKACWKYTKEIGKQTSKNKNWSHMTSPSRSECKGKSTLYCHTAWHQHLNAGTEEHILRLCRLMV